MFDERTADFIKVLTNVLTKKSCLATIVSLVMSQPHRARKPVFDPKKDRRSNERPSVGVKGRIFFPDRQYDEDCIVVDLSPDGAGLRATFSAATGERLILYVDGLGRFEGKIIWRDRLRIGVQFKCSETKRARVADLIAAYLEFGSVSATAVRETSRVRGRAALHSFTRASGEKLACEIVDMALSGASLRTDERPDVGETILFGRTIALVVRHTACGIAVTFTGTSQPRLVASMSGPTAPL